MDVSGLSAPCPICGSEGVPKFYAGGHRMFRCRSCWVTFVHPLPTEEFLAGFYSRFHVDFEQGGCYDLMEERMSADFPAKVAKIKGFLTQEKNSSRILDVGCGKGFFVRACLDAGLQADGIDLSDTAVNFAKSRLKINAICGRLEEVAPSLAGYNAVTFWATIEHVREPLETLSAIRRVLRPGGLLFLDTGIGDDWLDQILPGRVQWYDPPQHLFVFSKKSLVIALEKSGFTVENIDTCFERSLIRRVARISRGISFAIGTRFVAALTRTKEKEPFGFTRFPLGNLMSVVARASG